MARYFLLLGLVACRYDFDPVVAVDSELSTTVSTGSISTSAGRPTQTHLIRTDAGVWWLFYIDDQTDVLRSAYSHDLASWTFATAETLAHALVVGTNFSVAYKRIAGVDVVHVVLSYTDTLERHDHLRGVLSATAIAWDAESEVGCDTPHTSAQEDGPVVVINTANTIFDFDSAWDDDDACTSDLSHGNMDVTVADNVDLGTSWIDGWSSRLQLAFTGGQINAHWAAALAGNRVLDIQTDGASDTPANNLSDLWWTEWDGATWSARASIFATPLMSSVGANDWTAVKVSNADVRVLVRLNATSYAFYGFDGTAWSAGAAIPDLPSIAESGPFMVSDGSHVWLFVIDVTNELCSIEFDGSAWGTWSTIDTATTPPRSNLTGVPTLVDGKFVLLWVEHVGATNNLVAKLL